LWEQEFILLYHIPGMTASRIGKMSIKERVWWFKRLSRQKKDEADAVKTK
jgi:hypothetical protein